MKFDTIYPDTETNEIIKLEYHLRKDSKIAECACCGSMTRWFDLSFNSYMCSEKCCKDVDFENKFKNIKEELKLALLFEDEWKDIIIVVKDQLMHFKQCIESIQKYTKKILKMF